MPIRNDTDSGPLSRFLGWVGSHERGFLLSVAALLVGLSAFALLADEVMEGGTVGIDRKILMAMRNPHNLADPVGPPIVEEAARDITALGGNTILAFLTVVIGVYMMLDGKRRLALFLWGSVCTGTLMGSLLKYGFARPRPALVPHSVYVSYSSFPSGHAMLSAVTFLTLGALLARSDDRRRMKAFFMLVAAGLTLAVGVTRVYLGVHWPTDVLAGWAAGAIWALLCWTVARWLQRRRKIETDSGGQ
ncbi:MAG: phosphatase PAP2 family protein [Bryobacteraceae bacterium]|nr:phosphatase PAP2 family protein [Bryobacteraceae bacterium]